jgi:hypothetical protein
MDDNRWEDLILELNRKFKVEEERFEDLIMQTQDGPVKQGQAEVLIFETPMGKIKLVRESKPIVLDKKEHYSHQQGKTARIEYKFSDSEFSHKMKAYKWSDDEDDWVEMNAEAFSK